jgi:hypothetical protein
VTINTEVVKLQKQVEELKITLAATENNLIIANITNAGLMERLSTQNEGNS